MSIWMGARPSTSSSCLKRRRDCRFRSHRRRSVLRISADGIFGDGRRLREADQDARERSSAAIRSDSRRPSSTPLVVCGRRRTIFRRPRICRSVQKSEEECLMKCTDLLTKEHKVILRALDILDHMAARIAENQPVPVADVETIPRFLRAFADNQHQAKEESALFPELLRTSAA